MAPGLLEIESAADRLTLYAPAEDKGLILDSGTPSFYSLLACLLTAGASESTGGVKFFKRMREFSWFQTPETAEKGCNLYIFFFFSSIFIIYWVPLCGTS